MVGSGPSGAVDCAFLGVVCVGELEASVRSMTLGGITMRFEGSLKNTLWGKLSRSPEF